MQALDQLKTARSILAPSYVFAYFFFGQEMFRVRGGSPQVIYAGSQTWRAHCCNALAQLGFWSDIVSAPAACTPSIQDNFSEEENTRNQNLFEDQQQVRHIQAAHMWAPRHQLVLH
jgi:hypothetical protein